MIIDRYKLLQLVGEGGFGSVYMAEQTAQDGLIQKILEARGLWDPRWLRAHRRPPPQDLSVDDRHIEYDPGYDPKADQD